jgi:hypothetical protein
MPAHEIQLNKRAGEQDATGILMAIKLSMRAEAAWQAEHA